MSDGEQAVSDLQDNLGNMAEEAMNALTEKFTQAVVDALGEAFQPLQEAFGLFEELSNLCGGNLEDSIGQFTEKIEAIVELVEAIKPVVDIVKQFL